MSVIDPRGFEGDVVRWSDQMFFLLQRFVPQLERLDNPDNWRDWALSIVGAQDEAGQDAPDPYAFEHWEDWAERLFQTQEF
jgi:hypothetical protein